MNIRQQVIELLNKNELDLLNSLRLYIYLKKNVDIIVKMTHEELSLYYHFLLDIFDKVLQELQINKLLNSNGELIYYF